MTCQRDVWLVRLFQATLIDGFLRVPVTEKNDPDNDSFAFPGLSTSYPPTNDGRLSAQG